MYYSILCKCYILISVLGVCGQVFGQINPFIKRYQPPNIGAYHKQQNAMFSERPQIISDSIRLRDSHKNTHETRGPFRELEPQPRQQQVFYEQKKQMPYQSSVSHLRPTNSQQQITPHRRHVQQFHKNTAEIRQFQTYSSPDVDVIQKPLRNYRLPENSERKKRFNKRTDLSNTEGNDYEEEEPRLNDNVLEKPQRLRNLQTLPTNVREEEPQELQRIEQLPKHLRNMQQFRVYPEERHEIERKNIAPIPQEMRRYQTMAPPRMEESEDYVYKPKNREEISVNRFESHSTNVNHEETDRIHPNKNRGEWHRGHSPIEEEEAEEFGPEPEGPVNRMPKNQFDVRRHPTRPPFINEEPNRNPNQNYIQNRNTFQNFRKVNELQNRNHIQHQFTEPEPKIERKVEMQKYYPIQDLNHENRVDKNSGENIQNYPHHNVQHTIERQHNIPHQSISLRPMPLVFQRDRDQQEFPFQKNHIIKQSHHFDPFERKGAQKQRQQMPNENIERFKGPFKKEVALIREITEILPSNDENFDRLSIDKPSPPHIPAIYSPFDRKDEPNEPNEDNERNEDTERNEDNERNDKTVELLRDENFYDDDDVPKTEVSESRNRDKDNDRLKSKFEREVDISADDLEKYFDREFANENEKDEEAQKKIDFEDTNESNQQLSKKDKDDDLESDEPELEYKSSDDFLKNHDDFLNKIDKENNKFRKETDNKEDDDNDSEAEEENKKNVDDGEKELDESDKKGDEEEETTDTKQSKQNTNKDDSSSDGDEKNDSTSNEESKEKTKSEAEDDETESESKKVIEKETEKKSNNKEDQENDEKQENETKDEEENDKQKSDKTNDENDEKCAENKCETEVLKEEESKELKTREELEKSLSQESKDDLISKSDRKEKKSLTTTEANPTIVRENNRLNRASKTETYNFSPYFIDLKRINTKKTNTLDAEKQNNLGNDTNSQRVMTTSATKSPRRKSSKRKNSSKSNSSHTKK